MSTEPTEAERQQATLVMARLPISLGDYRTDALDATVAVIAQALADQRAQCEALNHGFAAQALRAAAQEQRNEADQVPWDDEGTHADGHRCAADFLDRRAKVLEPDS